MIMNMRRYVLGTLSVVFYFKCFVRCNDSEPLYLTPLLENGKYKEAKDMSRVVPDIQGVKSYSGYFTVNQTCGNNLFFWFTPAERNWESAPVLLWLSGGPGCSSLIGMFMEIGPYDFDKKFKKRQLHWSRDHNIVYLDQPVGTGFSFTNKNCYAKDLKTAIQEAYLAVVQFFTLFPNLQKNKFFIVGESYSGHYIPALAHEIDINNKNAKIKINMIGILVGNPAIDDRCVFTADYFYQLGMIDEKSRDDLIQLEKSLSTEITKGDYKKSINASDDLYATMYNTYLPGYPNFYNILYDKPNVFPYQMFIRRYNTRKIIHVGPTDYFTCSTTVYEYLEEDIYTPAQEYIQKLLQTNKYTVGFYSGHLDSVCPYTSLPCVLRQLKWPGAADYLAANRTQWYVGERLAGWYKTAGNLFEVVVRDSGHFVPNDQPEAALDLLKAFVADKPGTKLLTKLTTEKST